MLHSCWTQRRRASDGLFGSSKLCANQIPIAVVTELIGPVLSDPAVLIVGQNII